jgi:hypothetical protein
LLRFPDARIFRRLVAPSSLLLSSEEAAKFTPDAEGAIIAVTGYGGSQEVDRARDAGFESSNVVPTPKTPDLNASTRAFSLSSRMSGEGTCFSNAFGS